MTIQATANAFLAAFTTGTRTDGSTYVCLRDGSPEWMTDAIREAHGGMLPNDGIYERCQDALRHIADNGDSDAAGEWADSDVSVYTAQRAAWLAEAPITRMALCDEATDQYGAAESVSDTIARGWFMESEQIYAALWNACDLNDVDEAA